MVFRDDELATQSRVDVLQDELTTLRAENDALKAKKTPKRETQILGRLVWGVVVVGLGLAALAAWRLSTGHDQVGVVLVVMATTLLSAAIPLGMLMRLIVVVPPGHIAVFSGRRYIAPDGQARAFRIVPSGSSLRIPIVERCDVLNTGPFLVETVIRNIYVKGSGSVDLHWRASLALARDEPFVVNAIERFLGRDEAEITTVGHQTLEGALRGMAALLTIQELREDRMRVAETLRRSESEADFENLGLILESFHILDVTEA